MNQNLQSFLLRHTGATNIVASQVIQKLWSGYSEIVRVHLEGGEFTSVVLKIIRVPNRMNHPRGWNSEISHQRKLTSYRVEEHWYKTRSFCCDDSCRVAQCYAVTTHGNEHVLMLEDLNAAGYDVRKPYLSITEIQHCLDWLASFHAMFLGENAIGLWPVGTYWHLATRPDELAVMHDRELQGAAAEIDAILNSCKFQTLVHGDAKLANFCFSRNGEKIAAVDFQYVGGGCGMKDVAYFLGSCLDEEQCFDYELPLLAYYFNSLEQALLRRQKNVNFGMLKEEWANMFPLAWTDFYRFVSGWAPDHQKMNAYSEAMAKQVLKNLRTGKYR